MKPTTIAGLLIACVPLVAEAALVRCTSKDGRSSVIRKDKCDSPDDIMTPVQAKSAIPAEKAPAKPPAVAGSMDDALSAYNSRDYARAVAIFEPLANQGDALAQIMMSDAYHNGNGVAKNDKVAYAWARKAADRGDARAQGLVAAMMQDGMGVPKDEAGAILWLEKSARQGFAITQVALASAYIDGRGVAKNKEQAAFWLRKAAAQGNADAQRMLAQLNK